MNIFLIIFLCFDIFFEISCENKLKPFLGHWKAEWSISKNRESFLNTTKSPIMHGVFSFNNKGSVLIQGFGYPNCLFSEDTIIYNANWLIKDGQLVVGNKEKNEFYYNIESLDSTKIKMTLLDDIHLILSK